jgi:dTMP kinase
MFITLEGVEGSGKTTQLPLLAEYLQGQGYNVLITREPGGTPVGDQIRRVLLDLKNTSMLPRTEILLFQASRAQLVEEVIKPQLARGGIILCDRYADSTLAYQGYGYQVVDLEQLRQAVHFATSGLKPDLTLFLDVDVEMGLRRRNKDGDLNRLDVYRLEFYQRVRAGYQELIHLEPQRWVVVDASQTLEAVQETMRKVVMARLKKLYKLNIE